MKKIIVYCTEFILAKRVHIGILAFVTSFFYLRCIGVTAYHPFIPWVSFFIVWSAYLKNLNTDVQEDRFNVNVPHGISPQIEARLYRIEKMCPVFYLIALGLAFAISMRCFVYAFCAMVIFASYDHKWVPVAVCRRKRLKDFYIVKNTIPPLGWVFSVAIVPFVASGAVFIPEYLILMVMLLLFFIREEIKFDIPDVEGDSKAGIKTLPNTLGESQTMRIINLINYILTLLLFSTLLALWSGLRIVQFEALLKNVFPFLTSFVCNQDFTNVLFEKKSKEYCNIGVLWWSALLLVYLSVPYPYNIWVYISFRFVGSFFVQMIADRYLSPLLSGTRKEGLRDC